MTRSIEVRLRYLPRIREEHRLGEATAVDLKPKKLLRHEVVADLGLKEIPKAGLSSEGLR